MARVILVIALALVMVMGVTAVGCDGVDGNGDIPNGDTPNGEVPNGDEPNGDEPNGDEPNGDEPAEPDLVSGLGLVIDCDENTGAEPEVGDTALDFRFQDAIDTTFALSDFRGRVVMLNFWRTKCNYCIAELPHIQQLYDEWPATELVLLTIDKGEEPATVATYMQDEGLSFPVLVDREEKVSGEYEVTGLPRTFFIDEEGVIQVIKRGYFHTLADIEAILNQLLGQ
ncbi:MAG: redoxin domain-containing protein [Dehalococcoidia bacterium]|nr:redoxin domain-containing protein [Dehalococcoidia bacterium]